MKSSISKIISAVVCFSLCITCFCSIPAVADAPVNVLAGKIATCTAGRATGTLSKLTDGKYNYYEDGDVACTFAHVAYGPGSGTTLADHSAYFEYSFDDVIRLNSFKIYLCSAGAEKAKQNPRDIAIDVQLEDGTWQRVAADYNITYSWSNNASGTGGTYDEDKPFSKMFLQYNFAPVDCVKIRITSNRKRMRERTGNEAYATSTCVFRLAEIQAFYDPSITTYSGVERPDQADYAVPMPASLTNYALGGTVTTKGTPNASNGAANLTDGSKNNRAISYYYQGTTTPTDAQCLNYYDIAFDGTKTIDRLDLVYSKLADDDRGHREQDVAVDAITSDGRYVRVAEKHGFSAAAEAANGSNYTLSLTFDTIEAIGVRISANCKQTTKYTNAATSVFQCYAEVEAYNDPNVVSNTGIEDVVVAGTAIPEYNQIFSSHQLVLGSEIGVKFALNLSSLTSAMKSSSYLEFTVSGETETVPFENAVLSGGEYIFTCYVSAGQMAESIDAAYHYGSFTVADNYSVEEYVTWANGALGSGTTLNLINAMSDYGYFATEYLNALHGSSYTNSAAVSSYTGEQISAKLTALNALNDNEGVATSKELNADITSVTYKLNLDTETTLKVYINLRDGYMGTFTASATDGVNVYTARLESAGKYVIEIPGLKVAELNKKFSISGTTDAGTFTVSNLSALTYVRTALKTTSGSQQNLRNAMAGLYDYYTSAIAYING